MSLKPAHVLIFSKLQYKHVLHERNLKSFDRQIERSLRTLRSKQAKRIIEQIDPPKRRRAPVDWKRISAWFVRRSQPKYRTLKFSDRKERKRRRLTSLPVGRRTLELARPRLPRKKFELKFAGTRVKKSALTKEASERTASLAQVLARFKRAKFDYDYSVEATVAPNALVGKPSARVLQLAAPRAYPKPKEKKKTPSGVAVAALQASVSDRVELLSKPKQIAPKETAVPEREYTENGVAVEALSYRPSENILSISKPRAKPAPPEPSLREQKPRTKNNVVESALKYKPTKRILALAKPAKSGGKTKRKQN